MSAKLGRRKRVDIQRLDIIFDVRRGALSAWKGAHSASIISCWEKGWTNRTSLTAGSVRAARSKPEQRSPPTPGALLPRNGPRTSRAVASSSAISAAMSGPGWRRSNRRRDVDEASGSGFDTATFLKQKPWTVSRAFLFFPAKVPPSLVRRGPEGIGAVAWSSHGSNGSHSSMSKRAWGEVWREAAASA
jgi:hypothetical protein